jgi:coatomer protein complex subunit alpha (xenin)
VGQGPLAYLTAATHGLTDDAERLAAAMGVDASQLPPVSPDSRVLLPPEPVCLDQSNWPLLTMSKVPPPTHLLSSPFFFLVPSSLSFRIPSLVPSHTQGFFDAPSRPVGAAAASATVAAVMATAADAAEADTAAWGDDDVALDGGATERVTHSRTEEGEAAGEAEAGDGEAGGWGDDDVVLEGLDDTQGDAAAAAQGCVYVPSSLLYVPFVVYAPFLVPQP